MKTYSILIKQILTGYVDIEASSPEEALKIVEQRYNFDEETLPTMNDVDPFEFEIISDD
jgi:hypothetical protein